MNNLRVRNNAGKIGAIMALTFAVCIALLGTNGQAQAGAPMSADPQAQAQGPKVEQRVLNDTVAGKTSQFMVLLSQQADVSKAYGMKDQDARGWYVYNTLRDFADKTQAPIRSRLTAMGVTFHPYWVANVILVTGDRSVVDTLAAMPQVAHIESNDVFRGLDDSEQATATSFSNSNSPNTVEWGVQRVNAPQVWAMGYTGQGIVVGNQDTGMRWTHNAIKPHYRGWNGTTADHNYNWYDGVRGPVPGHTTNPCGYGINAPCDDQGHGTHTTGTTTGDDGAGNQVGVAPGAKWIGCRNMDAGDGRPETYSNCFQFFMAPTDLNGQNANPALRPHVMNNSWGCPTSEMCAANTLQAIVENTQASGIFVEASAGNSGPSCSTVTDPPAIYAAAFSTGALDINNALASFSSRGPVTVDGSNRMKPEISGPGVSVRSSVNTSDTSYSSFSGTSMAGPHVVGAVALLWSAHPEMSRQITQTKTLLENTANPNVTVAAQTCGGVPSTTIPNNQFGYGRVDVLAAVGQPITTPTAIVSMTVSPTPTQCAGGAGTWADVAPVPTLRGRAVGVTLGTNIFLFGGRAASTVYGQEVFRYDTVANSWTTLAATFPDLMSSNMSGGVLTFPEGQRIFVVGGSGTGSVYTGRAVTFDPATNTFATKTSWPAAPAHLPGGWAVANNKFYIFGGIDVNTQGFSDIWSYDPTTNAWTQLGATLSIGRGYIATELMPDGLIYIAGGSAINAGTLTDETVFEKFNPATNTITLGPSLPTGTSNNHGYNVGGKFYVPGGGFTTTSTDVQVFDPASNTWSLGVPLLHAVRNYSKGYGQGGAIHVIGGIDQSGATFYDYNQKFTPGGGSCPSPTISATVISTSTPSVTRTATTIATTTNTPSHTATTIATTTNTPSHTATGVTSSTATSTGSPIATLTTTPSRTATRTATSTGGSPTLTSTPCTISFSDVPTSDPFYTYIRCLFCKGAISGYSDNTFRPANNATRGQMTKIVVIALGIATPTPTGTPTFNDVPSSNGFYLYIEAAARNNIVSGYSCGGPSEPCPGLYFRPNANVTRGQLSKIVVVAANVVFSWPILNPTTASFSDVPPNSPFYVYIETAKCHGVISGYADGTFRPNTNATRGQISKIVCITSQNPASTCGTSPSR